MLEYQLDTGRHVVWASRARVSRCRTFTYRRQILPVCRAGIDVKHPSIVTIGEALYDCLADQLGKPKEEVSSWTPYPGGAPANVATAASRLGDHTAFISAIGDDTLGEDFVHLLRDRHVNVEYIQRVKQPTRDVLVTRTLQGDREFAGFGKSTESYADCFIDENKIPSDLITNASVCVTGTLGLAYKETRKSIEKVTSLAKNSPCTMVIDLNWRPVFWNDERIAHEIIAEFVHSADLLKITDEEAEWLLGIPAQKALENPYDILAHFPNAKGVLVSAGEKGSSYSFRSGGKTNFSGEVPVLPVKIADTTGAGDAYLAGFLHFMLAAGGIESLLVDADVLHRGVQFATACGAATCTRPGAIDAQPTLQDVEALLVEG
jgi:fructokinase